MSRVVGVLTGVVLVGIAAGVLVAAAMVSAVYAGSAPISGQALGETYRWLVAMTALAGAVAVGAMLWDDLAVDDRG